MLDTAQLIKESLEIRYKHATLYISHVECISTSNSVYRINDNISKIDLRYLWNI